MVSPTEYEFLRNVGSLCKFLAAFRSCASFKEFADLVDAGLGKFLCINVTYAFDVNDL